MSHDPSHWEYKVKQDRFQLSVDLKWAYTWFANGD